MLIGLATLTCSECSQQVKYAAHRPSPSPSLSYPDLPLSQLLGSITPQKAELAVNSLAPFFLVTHNPNGGGSSATGSGSGTPQLNTSNATLGQAVIDNMVGNKALYRAMCSELDPCCYLSQGEGRRGCCFGFVSRNSPLEKLILYCVYSYLVHILGLLRWGAG